MERAVDCREVKPTQLIGEKSISLWVLNDAGELLPVFS
jgi:hypothetical protein